MSDRVALVTGAGRGIGRVIAHRLAHDGFSVALVSRGEPALRATERELRDAGARVVAVVADISDREQVNGAFEHVAKHVGHPAILINNAQSWGLADAPPLDPIPAPVASLDDRELDHTLRSGLYGTLYCMQAAYSAMRDAGWGRVINFSSPVAAQAVPGYVAYSSTKAAIVALSRTAAREWGKDGITVNCVSPLVVDDGGRNRFDAIQDPEARAMAEEEFWSRLAVNQDVDPKRDLAAAIAYLVSDEASFITGSLFSVDGGLSI